MLALTISFLGASCLAISTFSTNKKQMLIWQIGDYIFTILANLLLGGFTGAISIAISLIRNYLLIKNSLTTAKIFFLMVSQIGLALSINRLGVIGLLPIMSSLTYSLAIFFTNHTQLIRLVIIENMVLWLIYDITIKSYPAAIMDCVICLITCLAIYKHYRRNY